MPCVLPHTDSNRIWESVFPSIIPKIRGCTNHQGYSFGCWLRGVALDNSWVRLDGESLSRLLYYQIILGGHLVVTEEIEDTSITDDVGVQSAPCRGSWQFEVGRPYCCGHNNTWHRPYHPPYCHSCHHLPHTTSHCSCWQFQPWGLTWAINKIGIRIIDNRFYIISA